MSSLIVASRSKCLREKVIKRLIEKDDEGWTSSWTNRETIDYVLRTKYYTAALEIHSLHLGNGDEGERGGLECLGSGRRGLQPQGLILVFDAQDSKGLEMLEQWADIAKEHDCELCLYVAVHTNHHDFKDTEPNDNGDDGAIGRLTRCLDHGFEYIEVKDEMEEEVAEYREKIGLARVLECVESTMWKGLVRSGSEKHITSASSEGEGEEGRLAAIGGGNEASTPPHEKSEIDDISRMTGAAGRESDRNEGTIKTNDTAVSRGEGEEAEEGDVGNHNLDIDELFDQIREMKVASKELSDTDRRARASALAMRLASVLGLENENDG